MSDDIPSEPDLENVLDLVNEGLMESIRTHLPGQVVSYDATKQSVSVKLLVKGAFADEDGQRQKESQPILHDVPVSHFGPPRGRITCPVASGDLCLVMFCSSSIARVKLTGREDDPGDDRKHQISDAVALVGGFHNLSDPGTDAPANAFVIHCSNGVKILLGASDASDPVLRLSDLVWLIAAFNSHTHLVSSVPSSGPATVDIVHTIPVPNPDGSSTTFTK